MYFENDDKIIIKKPLWIFFG